jgi:N-acetylgalactosamine kinase
MVLAVKLGMRLEEARTSVNTLSDVEGLCVKYASAHGSSSPEVAVEVHKSFLFLNLVFTLVDYDKVLASSMFSTSTDIVLLSFFGNLFKILQKFLHEIPYNTDEIEDILQEKLSTIMKSSSTSLAVLAAATQFKLYQVRSLHLLENFLWMLFTRNLAGLKLLLIRIRWRCQSFMFPNLKKYGGCGAESQACVY